MSGARQGGETDREESMLGVGRRVKCARQMQSPNVLAKCARYRTVSSEYPDSNGGRHPHEEEYTEESAKKQEDESTKVELSESQKEMKKFEDLMKKNYQREMT